jgi:hypothetical protein
MSVNNEKISHEYMTGQSKKYKVAKSNKENVAQLLTKEIRMDLGPEKLAVKKGYKGTLITAHSNPRALTIRDHWGEFHKALGGVNQGREFAERFKTFNEVRKTDSLMADGRKFSVVEHDVRVYGLKWANNSCPFDTVLTVLLYFFNSLSDTDKRKFVSSWGLFGEIFLDVNVSCTFSIAQGKSRMLPSFLGHGKFLLGTFYSLETVWEYITKLICIDVDEDIVRINYDVTKICQEVGCPGVVCDRLMNNTDRQLSYFESSQANDGLPNDMNVPELIFNYWARRIDMCKTCANPLAVFRTFNGHPAIITVSIAGMTTRIDTNILYGEVQYSIFAVGYRGDMHFIALIKLQNEIFEYDGMIQNGLLRRVGNATDNFGNEIHDTTNRTIKAVVIWYTKSLL